MEKFNKSEKLKNFLARLKKCRNAQPPPPFMLPPINLKNEVATLPKVITKLGAKQRDDLTLEKRLYKRIKALKLEKLLKPQNELSPLENQPQKKRGIMDDIGEIFECTYAMPTKRHKHIESQIDY